MLLRSSAGRTWMIEFMLRSIPHRRYVYDMVKFHTCLVEIDLYSQSISCLWVVSVDSVGAWTSYNQSILCHTWLDSLRSTVSNNSTRHSAGSSSKKKNNSPTLFAFYDTLKHLGFLSKVDYFAQPTLKGRRTEPWHSSMLVVSSNLCYT